MWRERDSSGKGVRRTTIIGTIEEYPTKELAQAATNGLRMRINEERNRQLYHAIKVSDLIDHYLATELSTADTRHSHASELSTENFYLDGLGHGGANFNLTDVRTIAVESWLKELRRRDGKRSRQFHKV